LRKSMENAYFESLQHYGNRGNCSHISAASSCSTVAAAVAISFFLMIYQL
jgi:hypothetical protein